MAIWSRNPSKRPATDEPPTRIIGGAAPEEDAKVEPTPEAQPQTPQSGQPSAVVQLFADVDVSDEPPTIDMDGGSVEPKTAIVGSASSEKTKANDAEDPPAGFLVIVDGPGKGNHIAYGYGVNTIGRSSNQRIQLDFGDANISRENHAQIVFDPKSRQTLLRHEQGTNLTYARGEAVLTPIALEPRETFKIADTTLLVLPLCDADWDWAELDES